MTDFLLIIKFPLPRVPRCHLPQASQSRRNDSKKNIPNTTHNPSPVTKCSSQIKGSGWYNSLKVHIKLKGMLSFAHFSLQLVPHPDVF